MKKRKRTSEAEMIARFREEARLVLAKRHGAQGRLLAIAAAAGRDMEPVGRLAGSTFKIKDI
ncbi:MULTISPECIES: hypothetical protein [Stutzerimonas]|jgi:hypothetical protein|uniref:hypothetical protein n=1 Tax=Stutzerimonas TaxID=2901164 RepID=UPI0009B6E7DC|nr:hypothetical protein [Stutzerimonas stutzeri]PNG12513.1 hypothetical protein CXK97_18660 [Stutzerimonas stutzeri]